jgi:hypothetical protein
MTTTIQVSALALACSAFLAACGGGGDGSSGATAQSINFPYPGARHLADAPAPLTATATSGLAVTFTSNTPDVCTVSSDGNLVPVSAGECSITASQPGNSDFAPADPAQQLFKVLKNPQTITFKSPGFQDIGQGQITLSASTDSGLPVTFDSSTPDVCAVSGSTLTLVSLGQCTVNASQPGDTNHDAATTASVSFTVGLTPPPTLTVVSGYNPSTNQTADNEGVDGYSGSNLSTNSGQWWCPSNTPTWCGSAISADGTSFTYHYWFQPNDTSLQPNHDGYQGAYEGVEAVAAGVDSNGISQTGNTTTGVQVDKQTTLKFNLGENPEWFQTITSTDPSQGGYHMADVNVTLVLGHFALKNGGACNVAISATLTPTGSGVQPYEMQLADFKGVAESCGLSGLDPATELKTYPIVKIKFDVAHVNMTVARTPAPNPNWDTFPTELTLSGAITVQ